MSLKVQLKRRRGGSGGATYYANIPKQIVEAVYGSGEKIELELKILDDNCILLCPRQRGGPRGQDADS